MITARGIDGWHQVDMYDISDIVVPTNTLGLSTWWAEMEVHRLTFPSLTSEIEAALDPETVEGPSVSLDLCNS